MPEGLDEDSLRPARVRPGRHHGRALPREAAAVRALHAGLYLDYDEVLDLKRDPGRTLTRPQMELVAARTSWLNECFY